MLRIDKISVDEAMRFKRIRLQSLQESPEAFGSTFEVANSWDDANWISQVENLNTFIASFDGSDVGVARSVIDKDDSKTVWIISMWTAPQARGKKVGSKLIEAIIDWAKKQNVKIIKLDVVDSNRAAIGLYTKYGFLENGKKGNFPEPREKITEHQRELKL